MAKAATFNTHTASQSTYSRHHNVRMLLQHRHSLGI